MATTSACTYCERCIQCRKRFCSGRRGCPKERVPLMSRFCDGHCESLWRLSKPRNFWELMSESD